MPKSIVNNLTVLLMLSLPSTAWAGTERTFEPGSLIIPMDLTCQDHGMFQAYGLLFQLLRHGIPVSWVIAPDKTWHATPCNTASDECDWDCAEQGSGQKCPYPTASPDFVVSTTVVWDGEGQLERGVVISNHGYRGGPFVIDADYHDAALAIVDAWNDAGSWAENPWAQRTVFHVVSVHEATDPFTGYVRKEMVAAPTIAVFADGNENIATSYLRAAGIPQSNGHEFPGAKCGEDNCGPGTDNPDMLTVPSIMGDMGTCDQPVLNHKNGALFTPDGVPAFCQIMSMHWDVKKRETVECNGGDCPASQAECQGETFTYHGHEVVAEVRQFLQYPVHFFAECQAVNAYENTIPNPAWPYLDDEQRLGHFLTTTGQPPDCISDGDCTGTDTDYECAPSTCDNGTRDCCQPKEDKEKGAGFLIAAQPDEKTIQILHPEIPYNQLDGAYGTVGGSEPAYNLSSYLQTAYKNDLDVTFITGPDGPGDQDLWMTGFLDGDCWIGCDDDTCQTGGQTGTECRMGKVSFLGGHAYKTGVPLSQNLDSQGTRLFLNALFEADCVTTLGQPVMSVFLQGATGIRTGDFPSTHRYSLSFANTGPGTALEARLSLEHPTGITAAEVEAEGQVGNGTVTWSIGSIGSQSGQPGDPPSSDGRWAELSFPSAGTYELKALIEYRVGVNHMITGPATLTVQIGPDVVDVPDGGSSADGGSLTDGGIADSDGGQDDKAAGSDCGCGTRGRPAGDLPLWLMLAICLRGLVIRRKR